MNIFDFVTKYQETKVSTAAGHPVTITEVIPEDTYPLRGYAVFPNNFKFNCRWNIHGRPYNLPLNHGMELVALIPKITYQIVPSATFNNAQTLEELL
jgi:hypothetical protein